MKKPLIYLILVILMQTLAACGGNAAASLGEDSPVLMAATPEAESAISETEGAITPEVVYAPEDLDSSPGSVAITSLQLSGDAITIDGPGASADDSIVTITAAGTYQISGTLADGQIIVDTADTENVILILASVNITSQRSAPIYIRNAEKTILTLASGTENVVSDGTSYTLDDAESGEPNAAIFSKDDLTINGEGALTVNANTNNGIASRDDLKITGGAITVNAVNDGIKGKDSVAIRDGIITIQAGADGIQASNAADPKKGYVAIEGGSLEIISGLDGVQAEISLLVSGGKITISSGGGSGNNSISGGGLWGNRGMEGNPNKPTESAKGLKAGVDITITAGTIRIDSADDSLHSNNSITIAGGNLLLASGDDGIHADSTLAINGGEIEITQSYEGIESEAITIHAGNLHIAASDDGINAAGGADGSSMNGRPGQNNFAMSGNAHLAVNGGYIYVDAYGDGIDINGSIAMTGGVVIVNGPTANNNGALDYLGTFELNGGFLVAVGSSGMAQAPSTTSTQYSVLYNFPSVQAAGKVVHIASNAGKDMLTFVPTKEYQSVLLSSPELENGTTYTVFVGGSSTGEIKDGLYSSGNYSAGDQVASFTISSIVTGGGAATGRFPGGGRQPRP